MALLHRGAGCALDIERRVPFGVFFLLALCALPRAVVGWFSILPLGLEAASSRPRTTQCIVQSLATFDTSSGVARGVGAVEAGSNTIARHLATHPQLVEGAVASSAAPAGVDDSRRLEDCIVDILEPEDCSPAGYTVDTAGSTTQATRYVWTWSPTATGQGDRRTLPHCATDSVGMAVYKAYCCRVSIYVSG